MKKLIEHIIKNLVDKPDEVHVNQLTSARTIVCELKVGQGDMGKVIGKHGQTIRSIRLLLNAASAKQSKHTILELLE